MSLGIQPVGTEFRRNGQRVRTVGVNHCSMFWRRFMSFGFAQQTDEQDLSQMNAAGIKLIRVGFGWFDSVRWNAYYWGNTSLYWATVQDILDRCHNHGIGVIVNIAWSLRGFADSTFAQLGTQYYVSDFGEPSSPAYAMLKNYIAEFVQRFANHPAVMIWECGNETSSNSGNEYNKSWALDGSYASWLNWGTAPNGLTYPLSAKQSQAQYKRMAQMIVDTIHANDPWARVVLSGNAGGNSFAVNARGHNSLSADTKAQWSGNPDTETIPWIAYKDFEFSAIANHLYPGIQASGTYWGDQKLSDYSAYIGYNKAIADSARKPFALIEFGASYAPAGDAYSTDAASEQANFNQAISAISTYSIDISLAWNWDGDTAKTTNWMAWPIANWPSRAYQLSAISALNLSISQGMD